LNSSKNSFCHTRKKRFCWKI